MYIEFRLPQGASGMAASYCYRLVKTELEVWSEKYNIPYTDKVFKYTYRVCFDQDRFYSFFQLTWDPKPRPSLNNFLRDFQLITDLNNKI